MYYNIAPFVYKACNQMVPDCAQKLFFKDSRCELNRNSMSTKTMIRKDVKQRCISVNIVYKVNDLYSKMKM